MSSIVSVRSALLALGFVGSAAGSAPAVTNGGFETLRNGLPVDWSPVVGHSDNRYEVADDAHSGRCSLRLRRVVDKGEVGFNRAWRPDSGEQGTMLSQRKGGLAFWYKVVRLSGDAEMQFMAIPMNARPFEQTAARRTVWTVPREHVGDEQWHRAVFKYDYTADAEVKWVHVSGRLNTGTGEVLVDDVAYLPRVGPLVEVTDLAVATVGKAADERFGVSCTVANRGDEPTGRIAVGLTPPTDCRVTSDKDARALTLLGVDQERSLTWALRGRRTAGDELTVGVTGEAVSVRRTLELRPRLTVRLTSSRSMLFGDEPLRLAAQIENTGTAAAHEVRWRLAVSPRGALKARGAYASPGAIPVVFPGQTERPTWQVEPLRPCPRAMASLIVNSADAETVRHDQTFVSLTGTGQSRPKDVRWRCRGAELVFLGSDLGYGAVSIHAGPLGGPNDRDRLVGQIPRAGRVVVAGSLGADDVIDLYGKLTTTPDRAQIVARRTDRGGGTWRLAVRFAPGPADGLIGVTYELHCDQDRPLRAFEGPIIWVGEGSFGPRKRDAVVPGIEWLVGQEISSSDLDFAPDHPYRLRYVPHPNELTWPIMAVVCDRLGVGLMWDPQQRFDGRRRGPQPVFASPDHFSRRNHHLMGLMLPTVREMTQRNVRRAPEPLRFRAGQKWSITADLWVADAARDSLVALDTWMNVHDLPDPLPPPHGEWSKEIGFSMTAYLETLYDPKADGWLHTVNGPAAFQTPPAPHPSYGFDVWMGSHLAGDAEVRRRCKAMFDRMFVKQNRPAGADDMGFIMGRPDRSLTRWSSRTARMIHEQGPDGEWRFDADFKDTKVFAGFDYHELGPDNAVEVGLCARKAYEILLLARMTGDARVHRAGLKALAFMKRFEVPRAAQVWEVPVHSPDVLAAADAVDAYLEAYQIDGDQAHLAEAVRWARAGLPFVYVWHVPDYPWMQYGSIPVFGASWMKHSWIANLVQWNGLRYAYALIKLARYDRTRPWRRIATGLTISAMYQQHADGKLKALWPDSIRVDGPGRSAWEFAPRLILKNVYALTGRDEAPATRRVDGFVLSSLGTFRQIKHTGRDLHVELEIPAPLTSWLVVAGTSRPDAVRVDDQPVAPLPVDAAVLTKPGHLYRATPGILMVALPSPGAHRVTLTGVDPKPTRFLAEARTAIQFEFDRDTEGWQPVHHLGDLAIKAGRLTTRTTGPDPYLIRSALRVPTRLVKTITIRMQVDRGVNGQLFWTTNASPALDEAKSLPFKLHPGRLHEYRLPVGTHPAWTGDHIASIRIDPTDQPDARVEIDWVRGE